jgi:hypothetical protein
VRQGANVLRLDDGSLRCVLACPVPSAPLADVLAIAGTRSHPIQVVVQSRASLPPDADLVARLRAAHSRMLAELRDQPCPLVDRLLVVVPWDVTEGGDGPTIVNARLRQVDELLPQPAAPLVGSALDALLPGGELDERVGEVLIGTRWARTLLFACHPTRLDAAWFARIGVEHDLAVHLRPIPASGVQVACYLTLWTPDREDLDRGTERAEAVLAAHGVVCGRPRLQAEPALASSLPLCHDIAGEALVLRVSSAPAAQRSRPRQPGQELLPAARANRSARRPGEAQRFPRTPAVSRTFPAP